MIVASDLDGTLLDSNKQVGELEQKWIRNYLSKGHTFAILTSRNYEDTRKCVPWLVELIGCKRYIGFDEGARILLPDNTVYELPEMTHEQIKYVVSVISRYTDGITIFGKHSRQEVVFDKMLLIELRIKSYLKRESMANYVLWDAYKDVQDTAWKIKLKLKSKLKPTNVYNAIITSLPDFCVTLNEGRLEIMNGKSGKYGALNHICSLEDALVSEVIYFGDEGNDIYCIEKTCSYAMGNAPDWIKNSAQHITRTNDQHGVYCVLQNLNEGGNTVC